MKEELYSCTLCCTRRTPDGIKSQKNRPKGKVEPSPIQNYCITTLISPIPTHSFSLPQQRTWISLYKKTKPKKLMNDRKLWTFTRKLYNGQKPNTPCTSFHFTRRNRSEVDQSFGNSSLSFLFRGMRDQIVLRSKRNKH